MEQSRSARTSNTSYFYSTKSPNVLFAEATQLEDLNTNRITRILTTDFPQYFAIITRIRQEVHAIGPEGGVVNSTVVPQVQAVFPQGALTKKIKVGLQVNMFRPRKAALANGLFKKITVNHVPKKKRFSLIWWSFARRYNFLLSAQCIVLCPDLVQKLGEALIKSAATIDIFDQIQGLLNFATFISLKRKGKETAKETLCCQQSQF